MIRELGRLPRATMLAAARAADRDGRGVALLTGEGWGSTQLAVDPIETHRVEHGEDALDRVALRLDSLSRDDVRGWNGRPAAARYIGYVAYEAARSLERPRFRPPESRAAPIGAAMVLHRYAAVARRDDRTGIVAIEGDDADAIDALAKLLSRPTTPFTPPPLDLSPIDDDDAHQRRVERALELIAAGDLYVVNLARTFIGSTRALPTELLATLLLRTTAPFAAALDCGDHGLACSSPELFLDLAHGVVRTSPIKGTRPRGGDARLDEDLIRELAHDPKEAAELTMVVDLERNDLGRIADVGTVRVPNAPRIETTTTVHHRVADVIAKTSCSLGTIFRATFPSGSVTGAPKVRAMEVIANLERERRGVYCGAVLAVARDGCARAAMAIRTVVIDPSRSIAVYHAGGGIVESSIPVAEVRETLWKARQVQRSSS
jgi:anthranilate/para-aminobenzoate synthase component I